MKHFTLQQIRKLSSRLEPLNGDLRPPQPFPGRKFPTRVAWIMVIDLAIPHDGNPYAKFRKTAPLPAELNYLGKPNQFRALSAMSFARLGAITRLYVVEFDKLGPIAWVFAEGNGVIRSHAARYYAYHPQGGTPDPIVAFSKLVNVKRIGGLSTYSYQKRLKQEQVEKFYEWFEKTFKKKLRRPKHAPMSLGNDVEDL